MNPLLNLSKNSYHAVNFDQIKVEHFIPAIKEAISQSKNKLDSFKISSESNWKNILKWIETVDDQVGYINGIFQVLHSAHCTEEISGITEEFNQLLTSFYSDITLDSKIFEKIKVMFEQSQKDQLTDEEKTAIKNHFKSFKRNGALLDEDKKNRVREIDQRLSKLTTDFSENVRLATNDYLLVIDQKEKLEGLPDSAIEAAKELANAKGHPGKWAFSLQFPSYLPFTTYLKDRALRKEMTIAYGRKNFGGKFDNQNIILEIIKLRHERANILGYPDHASFVLEERMATSPSKVKTFIKDLTDKAKPAALNEVEKLKGLQFKTDGLKDFQRYDSPFYAEILKKQELQFDEEELRAYFPLENVIEGAFKVVSRLYNLEFKHRPDLPVYHPEVKVYEVFEYGKFKGLFYTDFYPRETKQPGAWMTNIFPQGLFGDTVFRPHVMIVCNFTKPTQSKPSLLKLDEVLTLFHEFGHALHGLLSECHYRSVSGTNVFWDFVELPSQIFENWVLEKECLDMFAAHYQTGEKIPQNLIDKIKKNQQFLEGMATIRQLTFGYLDIMWHMTNPEEIKNVPDFEKKILQDYSLLPDIAEMNTSTGFAHIFAGGYSAGYYSYKWAEVLDADAFEYFKSEGIFNEKVAQKFKDFVLSKGGSEHPMELYKKFRGKEPSVDALLKRSGL
jgi:peptidyl-dipeptidase Dcp